MTQKVRPARCSASFAIAMLKPSAMPSDGTSQIYCLLSPSTMETDDGLKARSDDVLIV